MKKSEIKAQLDQIGRKLQEAQYQLCDLVQELDDLERYEDEVDGLEEASIALGELLSDIVYYEEKFKPKKPA